MSKKLVMNMFKLIAVAAVLLAAGFLFFQQSPDSDNKFTRKQIDFEKIQWFAKRADAAYKSEEFITENFPKTIRVKNVEKVDIQYFLEDFPEEKLQVLSIRGTDNLDNIKEDAEFLQSRNKKLNAFVHQGFDRAATEVFSDVEPYLNKDYRIAVTGHSLGAAVATIIMMYLHEDGYQIEPSINFGQPKVTNTKGANAYAFLPITRIVDENDIVTFVPPLTFLDSVHGFYEHLGEEVILLNQKDYIFLDEHDASRKSIGNFWQNMSYESVKDHLMENYLSSIEAKVLESVQVPYSQKEQHIGNN